MMGWIVMVFSSCFIGNLLFKEWSWTVASIVQLLVCVLPILLPSPLFASVTEAVICF